MITTSRRVVQRYSGQIWLRAWSNVPPMCDAAGIGSIREFDDRFPLTQSLFNWCQDLEMSLQNGGARDQELRTARPDMAAEWLRRFADENDLMTSNFRRALADSYFETGQRQKADELYEQWLDDDPRWGWGWIGWADCYSFRPEEERDYARAEEILRRGCAVTGVRDSEDIADRLADLCEDTGRADEATELRRQVEEARDIARERFRPFRPTVPAAFADKPQRSASAPRSASGAVPKTGRNAPCPCGS